MAFPVKIWNWWSSYRQKCHTFLLHCPLKSWAHADGS
jgi:hypothetical protein